MMVRVVRSTTQSKQVVIGAKEASNRSIQLVLVVAQEKEKKGRERERVGVMASRSSRESAYSSTKRVM